jgi:hypothetical protein
MKTSTLISSVAIALSVSSFASAALGTYGTLNDGTNSVAFNFGTGIGNNDFWYSNTAFGSKSLTLGMKTIGSYGQNPNPEHKNDGTWEAQAGTNAGPSGSANAPTWNFIWSVTVDGAQPTENDNLYWSMRITGPNGNWGTTAFGLAALSGNFPVTPPGVSNPVYQNAVVCSFVFLQLSSAATPGVTPGLWDGLAFDPTVNGRYTFELSVFDGNSPTNTRPALSTLTMNVDVVPAPGAVALVGLAGLVGRRRRA